MNTTKSDAFPIKYPIPPERMAELNPKGLPPYLLGKLKPRHLQSIRPVVWDLVKQVYDYCREHEPEEMVKPKKSHNNRYNSAPVLKQKRELTEELKKTLTPDQLNLAIKPPEVAVLLSAQHNQPVNPYIMSNHRNSQKEQIPHVDEVATIFLYSVESILDKEVKRPRTKKPKAPEVANE